MPWQISPLIVSLSSLSSVSLHLFLIPDENQPSLEERGAIDIFMDLIKDRHPQTIRQVSEAFSPFSSLLCFSELQRIGQSSLERAV